ncbi:G-type lectin S-receptor-like serine/threonine-protein kinase SD2-2 [Humulus lupulus]|uniref:G-type lectin S-receptor-like serine/threonine-protein kinase SD2-2 n=1 Tax=Humulus lupulus TaxID=3486 RepID=UPI002B4138DC|nr:G-type lectin S-receptor-like serine/threonine-protein kinase SD2-2 [Humulus lupulus]
MKGKIVISERARKTFKFHPISFVIEKLAFSDTHEYLYRISSALSQLMNHIDKYSWNQLIFRESDFLATQTLQRKMLPKPPLPTIVFLLSLTFLVMISNANLTPNFETYETHVQVSAYSSKLQRHRRTSSYSLYGSSEISDPRKRVQSSVPSETTRQIEELVSTKVLMEANTTIFSKNNTFQLGFFTPDGSRHYLGICYRLISPPTYIWVANRERPIKNISTSTLEITETGRLVVKDSVGSLVWQSTNREIGTSLNLLENGNLVLFTSEGTVSWQSFDYPTDTWLPGMNLTTAKSLISWRSSSDPSPGLYSLRLRPDYSEFELVFNGSIPYWSTGNWTGKTFSNVPEMTVPYIYRFHFDNPFMATASFGFAETALDGLSPPLTRFQLHYLGQLKQNTWSPQVENWNVFWLEPRNTCLVFGSCGKFGLCDSLTEKCNCLSGFEPINKLNWESSRDYSDGCHRVNDAVSCEEKADDRFEQVGIASLDDNRETEVESFNSRLDLCQKACLENCTCVGVYYDERTNLCKHLFGSLFNLRNLTSDNMNLEVVHVRVGKGGILKKKKRHFNPVVLAAIIVGSIAVLGFVMVGVLFFKRLKRRKTVEEDGDFPVLTLKVFTYKELHQITRGFSEKIGHGGFGAVFQGKLLSDSTTLVAVKRLERPGSGEKEFRAEVCTIGNIQHVNLVRLRGFCSEDSHRLLVYDYMPNSSLSVYLRKEGPILSWESRFKVAIGTARGIAYLHEECRDCIIHCDIKPENILLDSDYTPKVSDFGLAKLLGRDFSRVLATMRGTWGYVAPEWISGVAITTKADVYSYGMTLIELIGGRRNVEALPSAGGKEGRGPTADKWFFPPWAARQIIEGNVAAVIDHRLGGAYDVDQARRVALVAVWCIQDDEAIRPTMGTVVKMLEGLVEVTVPPSPKLLQALVSGESFHGVNTNSGSGGGVPTGTGSGIPPLNIRLSNAGAESSLGNASSSPVNANTNEPHEVHELHIPKVYAHTI